MKRLYSVVEIIAFSLFIRLYGLGRFLFMVAIFMILTADFIFNYLE